jgi:membrane-associated phospholipid phosphatase
MGELPFSIELIRVLADGRTELLTGLFQFFTFLGEVEGYVVLVMLVFVAYDKRLAYRLSVLTLAMMSLNHLLKTIVMNPRPFVADGTYVERWAVSAEKAAELVTEYSTPSGHAMAGAAFYAYLFASVRNAKVRSACIVLILLTGLSRPYLGVHYLEDVLIGWVLGTSIALVAIRYESGIAGSWRRLSQARQIGMVAAASLILWIATRVLSDLQVGEPPLAFIGYMGFLMGVVVAFPLEARVAGFDPRSSPAWKKVLRYLAGVGLILGTLSVLDRTFEAVAGDHSAAGYVLRYVRYALAAVAGILVGPILFVRLELAETVPDRPGSPYP